MSIRVAAPGKAILVGEYAVLEGARAISTAIDRCVRVTVGAGDADSAFVAAARRVVGDFVGQAADVALAIDSTELYVGKRKLGLGSSAAVTVATVRALLAAAGRNDVAPAALWQLVDAAHQEAQVEIGSGVDVATAIWGGTIRFRREPFACETVKLPDQLRLSFVDIGAAASTAQLVGRVRQWKAQDATGYRAVIEQLTLAADRFAAATDANTAIAAARLAGTSMADLGRRADAPIVTTPFEKLAALAVEHGGASKPSGAGGGDLAVLFSAGDDATAHLRAAVTAAGFSLLDLGANAPGVSVSVEQA